MSSSPPTKKRRWLLALHGLAAAYVLPAFWLGGKSLARGSFADSYRTSATAVIGLLIVGWNFAYWRTGFLPRIYRLCPEVQARTGARVRLASRRLEWDRPVGWRDRFALQLHFLGLVLAAMALWGLLIIAGVTVLAVLQDGPAGAVKFFHR